MLVLGKLEIPSARAVAAKLGLVQVEMLMASPLKGSWVPSYRHTDCVTQLPHPGRLLKWKIVFTQKSTCKSVIVVKNGQNTNTPLDEGITKQYSIYRRWLSRKEKWISDELSNVDGTEVHYTAGRKAASCLISFLWHSGKGDAMQIESCAGVWGEFATWVWGSVWETKLLQSLSVGVDTWICTFAEQYTQKGEFYYM